MRGDLGGIRWCGAGMEVDEVLRLQGKAREKKASMALTTLHEADPDWIPAPTNALSGMQSQD